METTTNTNVNDNIEVIDVEETESANMTAPVQETRDPFTRAAKGFIQYVKDNPGIIAANAVSYILGHRRGFKKGYKLGKRDGRNALRSKMWFYDENKDVNWNFADDLLAGKIYAIEAFDKTESDVYEAVDKFRKEYTNPTARRYKEAAEVAMSKDDDVTVVHF